MTTPKFTEREQLTRIARAFQQGDVDQARRLVGALLRNYPRSVAGWGWACQLAPTPEGRLHCLERILAIDPANEAARRRLDRLRVEEVQTARDALVESPPRRDAARARYRLARLREFGAGTAEPPGPSEEGERSAERADAPAPPRRGCRPQLLGMLTWFDHLPTYLVLTALLVPLLTGGLYYRQRHGGLWPGAGPDFEALTISDAYRHIAAEEVYWRIEFEGRYAARFPGLVRHTSRIKERPFRILSHDILVTTGEFADPDRVSVNVVNHRFRWRARLAQRPEGTINLLHTVPADEEIYRQLLDIRAGDHVTVTGREILTIRAYEADGTLLGEWRDRGCNTLLVDQVEVAE